MFFYDLPITAVKGELAAALNVLHFGNYQGVFTDAVDRCYVDINEISAIEIDLTHRAPSGGDASYALMYFAKDCNKDFWTQKLLHKHSNLKRITTRVKLCSNMTDHPPHEHHLFTASNRFIDFSPYPERALSNYVPGSYLDVLNDRFVGYLMRSASSFRDVHEIFEQQHMVNILQNHALGLDPVLLNRVAAYAHDSNQALLHPSLG